MRSLILNKTLKKLRKPKRVQNPKQYISLRMHYLSGYRRFLIKKNKKERNIFEFIDAQREAPIL